MQHNYALSASVLSPEPKTQHKSHSRTDVQDWIDAEFIEMDTIYPMGTIVYVPNEDLPEGTTLIPTKFAYKCKFSDHCQVIKKKGRLVVRGDLQKEHKYTKTFALTLRFNTLRALMSVAVQQQLNLIKDKDIYIALPPGYE
eukprot:1995688-Rhodomonas_salina.1